MQQLRHQSSNGHLVPLNSVTSEPLTEVTEEASSASTSVKETSFVFSFKRKSTTRRGAQSCQGALLKSFILGTEFS